MKKSLLMIFVSAAMAASGADTIILKEDFSNPETVKAAWDIAQNKIENGQLMIGKNNKSVELKQKLTGKDNITISLEAALTENSGFGGIKIDEIMFNILSDKAVIIYKRPDVSWLDSRQLLFKDAGAGKFHKMEISRTKENGKYIYTYKVDGNVVYTLKNYQFPPTDKLYIQKSRTGVMVKNIQITEPGK